MLNIFIDFKFSHIDPSPHTVVVQQQITFCYRRAKASGEIQPQYNRMTL